MIKNLKGNFGKFLFIGAASFIFLIPITCAYFVKFQLMPKFGKEEQAFKNHKSEMLADLELLNHAPPFPDGSWNQNADSFLSQYITLEGQNIKPISSKDHDLVIKMFDQYPNWRKDPEQLKKFLADNAITQIDTSWLEQLEGFDHWNFSSRPEIKREVEKASSQNGIGRIGIWASLPIPRYDEARKWATLAFFKSYKNKKSLQGLKTFRPVEKATFLIDS